MKPKHLLAGSALCLMTFSFQTQIFASPVDDTDTAIVEGVYAGDVYLGGMTAEEAETAVSSQYDEIADSPFTVIKDGKNITTTLTDLGFTWNIGTIVEEASALGKSGALIERYKTLMDLKYGTVVLEVPCEITETAVRNFVEAKVAASDTPAKDATITKEGNSFNVTQHANGLVTNTDITTETILAAIQTDLKPNMTVEATVEVSEPTKTYEALSKIKDNLGTASTNYSSSASGRKTNIKVASGNINGSVVMPGEILSVSDTMQPRDAAHGYQLGGQYVDGETIEAYGGGVCQVSTTLYNALLKAELEITERSPHSMVVSYVDYSMDAAIAAGSKDLKFKNNTENPIYIAASADGSTLTFSVYGVETHASNRTVEYKSTTVSKSTPENKIVYDATKPVGFSETTGNVHPAVTSYLEKIVYENGAEVSRTKLHTDTYRSSYKTTVIGSAPAATTAAPVETTPPAANGSDPVENTLPASDVSP